MTQAVPTLIANGLEIQYVTLVDASGNAIATVASLGQKAMAASSPVVIASDQSAIPDYHHGYPRLSVLPWERGDGRQYHPAWQLVPA
jgi:hypothetical protein